MDPMSAISAIIGAVGAVAGAVGGIADLVKAGAGFFEQIFNNLTEQIGQSQQDQALASAEQSAEGLPQAQSEAITGPVYNIFGGSQLPMAA